MKLSDSRCRAVMCLGKSTLRSARGSQPHRDGTSKLPQALKPRSGATAAAGGKRPNCQRSTVVTGGQVATVTSTTAEEQPATSLRTLWKVVKCDSSNSIKLQLAKTATYPHWVAYKSNVQCWCAAKKLLVRSLTIHLRSYALLPLPRRLCFCQTLFVCLSVC